MFERDATLDNQRSPQSAVSFFPPLNPDPQVKLISRPNKGEESLSIPFILLVWRAVYSLFDSLAKIDGVRGVPPWT